MALGVFWYPTSNLMRLRCPIHEQIREKHAYCLSDMLEKCKVIKKYKYNIKVGLQL